MISCQASPVAHLGMAKKDSSDLRCERDWHISNLSLLLWTLMGILPLRSIKSKLGWRPGFGVHWHTLLLFLALLPSSACCSWLALASLGTGLSCCKQSESSRLVWHGYGLHEKTPWKWVESVGFMPTPHPFSIPPWPQHIWPHLEQDDALSWAGHGHAKAWVGVHVPFPAKISWKSYWLDLNERRSLRCIWTFESTENWLPSFWVGGLASLPSTECWPVSAGRVQGLTDWSFHLT